MAPPDIPFVAYYRVSTDRQGNSGLGLEAQRFAVASFIKDGSLLAEFEEVESGRRHKNRPALAAALDECSRRKAVLVIAKLDRLARNVHFISGLIESKVQFVCCDNPHVHSRDHHGRFVLHQLAVMAEWEAGAISQRTKDAMQQVKRDLQLRGQRTSVRGNVYTKLGNTRWQESIEQARQARHPVPPAPQVIELMQQRRAEGESYRKIADHLNGYGLRTPKGNRWHHETIRDLLTRTTKEAHAQT